MDINAIITRNEANPLFILTLFTAPRAIVHGLQGRGLSLGEQYEIIAALFEKYGNEMDAPRRTYLENQLSALAERI